MHYVRRLSKNRARLGIVTENDALTDFTYALTKRLKLGQFVIAAETLTKELMPHFVSRGASPYSDSLFDTNTRAKPQCEALYSSSFVSTKHTAL